MKERDQIIAGALSIASIRGEWSAPFSWPDVAIHLHVLPNGNVLTWADDDNEHYHHDGSRKADFSKAYVWNIGTSTTPAFQEIHNRSTNLFCSGHSFLPDGRLLIMGGHEGRDGDGSTDANIFDYRTGAYGAWSRTDFMDSGRWYPSAVSLASGEVLTVSGTGAGSPQIPEVWSPVSSLWRSLPGAARGLPLYPFLHVAPNGRVFMAGPGQDTGFLDTASTGAWDPTIHRPGGYRDYGTAVMFDSKVLVIGGGDPPKKTAELIDLAAAVPTWRSVASMRYARRQPNATLLPDGKVLVTGGTAGAGFNNANGAVLAAELWDPATEQWSTLGKMQVPRLYHSTAVLLPDGRVLSAGGGRPAGTGEPAGTEHRDAEIYSPPYLFNGQRPRITVVPEVVGYGQQFTVETPDATNIRQVTWIRLSSATHGFNQNQRLNRLGFTPTSGGVQVTAPATREVAPPGHYLLFILNADGVPSIGRVIEIG